MSRGVVDSSAILAIVLEEGLADNIFAELDARIVSAVNYAEIRQKITKELGSMQPGSHAAQLFEDASRLISDVVAFTAEQAVVAADLIRFTKGRNISLGDRACLALAITLGADVYTADRAWASLDLPCRIHLVR